VPIVERSLVYTPLNISAGLYSANVTGLARSHVSARFDVLDPCSRSSRNTYARSPTTPIYTLYLAHEDSSLSNIFVLTTHSYAYVAFFNYYPV
jgi:hypothetical protein